MFGNDLASLNSWTVSIFLKLIVCHFRCSTTFNFIWCIFEFVPLSKTSLDGCHRRHRVRFPISQEALEIMMFENCVIRNKFINNLQKCVLESKGDYESNLLEGWRVGRCPLKRILHVAKQRIRALGSTPSCRGQLGAAADSKGSALLADIFRWKQPN